MRCDKKYVYKLRSCVWEITLDCCFSCKYCGSRAGKARENELSTEECLDVSKQLSELGCRRVSLIGGEVFMRPDWSCIVQSLTYRGVKVSIITNGFLFSEEMLHKLKETSIESVAISIDGPEWIHDSFRQDGSFRRAFQTIDVLTDNKIPVSVISTLHSKNVGYLEDLYSLLEQKSIFAWQLQACSPMGNALDTGFSTKLNFLEIIRFVERHIIDAPFAIGIADNIGYYTAHEGFIRGNTSGKAMFRGCRAGLTSIGIDSVGNVRGCESMYDERFIEGNLRERSLKDIWNDDNSFEYNRKFKPELLKGKCHKCNYGLICAGGCRSYNFFTSGNLYESMNCACSLSGNRGFLPLVGNTATD